MTPTQRALAELRKLGAVVGVCEHWNPFAKRRIDLFNFIDIVALVNCNCIGIQCTSGTNHAARRSKILAEPKALAWLRCGNLIEVWSFSKAGPRGQRKVWTCRKEAIVEADFAESANLPTSA